MTKASSKANVASETPITEEPRAEFIVARLFEVVISKTIPSQFQKYAVIISLLLRLRHKFICHDFRKRPALADIFDESFLPPLSARKIN